jgi:hypothetical protein
MEPSTIKSTDDGADPPSILSRLHLPDLPPQMLAILVLAVALRILLAVTTQYTSEDYMITLRYAENLAHGHGLVYNVGERVLGTTTPLYTLILSFAEWLHLPPTICGKSLNIFADAALCLLVYLWLRHEGRELPGRIAAFVCAIHPLHLQWSISGMETELVTAAGVWSWYAFAQKRDTEMFAALGILFLLRWDSVMMGAVILGAALWRDRKLPLRGIGLFALIIAPWLVIAGRYYGNPIPVTGQAKVVVYGWFADHDPDGSIRFETTADGQGFSSIVQLEPTWLLRRLPRQQKVLNAFTGTPPALFLTVAACAGLVIVLRSRPGALLPAAIWAVLYLVAFLFSRVLLFNWYLVPPLPVYEMLAAIGLAAGIERVSRTAPERIRSVATASLIAGAVIGCGFATGLTLRRSQRIEENARIPAGRWLAANSNPADRILLEPIGYIGYYSRRYVIDTIGLVSPQVLRFYTGAPHSPWLAQIRYYQPEWCVLRPVEVRKLDEAAQAEGYDWRSNYTLAHVEKFAPTPQEEPFEFQVYRRVRRAGPARE